MVREIYQRFKLILWIVLFTAPVVIAEINQRYKADESVRIIYPAPPDGLLSNAATPQQLADASR